MLLVINAAAARTCSSTVHLESNKFKLKKHHAFNKQIKIPVCFLIDSTIKMSCIE